jgi:hypothetical protein
VRRRDGPRSLTAITNAPTWPSHPTYLPIHPPIHPPTHHPPTHPPNPNHPAGAPGITPPRSDAHARFSAWAAERSRASAAAAAASSAATRRRRSSMYSRARREGECPREPGEATGDPSSPAPKQRRTRTTHTFTNTITHTLTHTITQTFTQTFTHTFTHSNTGWEKWHGRAWGGRAGSTNRVLGQDSGNAPKQQGKAGKGVLQPAHETLAPFLARAPACRHQHTRTQTH